MKILLIGHSIIDRFEGSENDSPKPGGLFYNALGINSVSLPSDNIFALTSWNKNSFHLFKSAYSCVDLSFANEIENMPEVILRTPGEGEREELYKNLSISLSLDKITDWNSFDGILINMITGFDISLGQMKLIRQKYNGTIYCDVHTLSRGVDQNLKREFRPIPDVTEWLACFDIIQANENELQTIVENRNEQLCAEKILSVGPKILIVTKGKNGAHLYRKSGSTIDLIPINAKKINTVNKIGCGDIFGAVFFYSYISTKDAARSFARANTAGAQAAATANLTILSKLDL